MQAAIFKQNLNTVFLGAGVHALNTKDPNLILAPHGPEKYQEITPEPHRGVPLTKTIHLLSNTALFVLYTTIMLTVGEI